jgi:integrase
MSQRLTDKIVRALSAPDHGNRITYDSDVAGFGCRVTAAGARSFVLNYRRKSDGRERRATLGQFPAWGVAAARQRAAELRRSVDSGGDPVGEQAAERGAPTVADLCAQFESEHLPRLRPSTQSMYRSILKAEIVPALGSTKVAAVEYADIDRLHAKISRRAPYMANRVLAVLSRLFTLAIFWKMRPDSPLRGVQRNREHKRRRYLSADELARLTGALDKHPNRQAADVFWLLLLTGARKHEALSATWDQFNPIDGTWTKPAATTKQRTEHSIPLSAPARQLLARLREHATAGRFVFPGPGPRGYRTSVKRDWAQVCKAAGITGLRVHDLRHSFASQLASNGIGLHVIGRLLGHTQPQTTHRYAHLLDDPLKAAVERVGAIISGAPSGEIVPITKGRGRS